MINFRKIIRPIGVKSFSFSEVASARGIFASRDTANNIFEQEGPSCRLFLEQLKVRSRDSESFNTQLAGIGRCIQKTYKESEKNISGGNRPSLFLSYGWPTKAFSSQEWWVQPFLFRLALDLSYLGFDPKLDILRPTSSEDPLLRIKRDIFNSSVLIPIGTYSLAEKMESDFLFWFGNST